MAEPVGLWLSVPVTGLRVPHAREYFETLPVPPPSTVYGMLLSLVGEPDRSRHEGAEIAIAMLSVPSLSVVLRTLWRVKDEKKGPGLKANRRPEFQELLTGMRLAAWIRPGQAERHPETLAERVRGVLANPATSTRFGVLALGESTHLVDEVRELRSGDLVDARPLVADPQGDLSLPVWPNHVGAKGTVWGQYRLEEGGMVGEDPPEGAWTAVGRRT